MQREEVSTVTESHTNDHIHSGPVGEVCAAAKRWPHRKKRIRAEPTLPLQPVRESYAHSLNPKTNVFTPRAGTEDPPPKPRGAVAGPLLQHHWWFSQVESINELRTEAEIRKMLWRGFCKSGKNAYIKGKSLKKIIVRPLGNFSCVYKIYAKTSLALQLWLVWKVELLEIVRKLHAVKFITLLSAVNCWCTCTWTRPIFIAVITLFLCKGEINFCPPSGRPPQRTKLWGEWSQTFTNSPLFALYFHVFHKTSFDKIPSTKAEIFFAGLSFPWTV